MLEKLKSLRVDKNPVVAMEHKSQH